MQLKIEKSWHQILKEELNLSYIDQLKHFLEEEKRKGFTIYPPLPLVFNALLKTPFEKVNVVIMGQDPYHGAYQAHGLSFSVPMGITAPPSLKNIYKEIASDIGGVFPGHGCLEHWASQGVLLLNATLTVRAGQPRSHYGKGWERLTDTIIEKLLLRKDPIVFLLWGKSAQEKCASILNQKKHPHLVLMASHPSPYSAQNFFGCKHFSLANTFLKKCNKKTIEWI